MEVSAAPARYAPTRPLTTDDYEDAARTIAKCHNSRLPLVIDLYRKAGLDIQESIALFPEILYIFTIIPSSVDLPTPEPANIPTHWPLTMVIMGKGRNTIPMTRTQMGAAMQSCPTWTW